MTLKYKSIHGIKDNPDEFIIVKCAKCYVKDEGSRSELGVKAWALAVEPRWQADIDDHEGFVLCPECSKFEYTFDDLY